MPQIASLPRRARTDEQKQLRRQAIITVADGYFREVGFEGFSMAELAKRAGVVKGTLYLYFETREEVLLALYVELLGAWRDVFVPRLDKPLSDEDFVTLFFETSRTDPAFLTVVARLDSVIEHNVSRDKLIESKRALAAIMDEIIGIVAQTMNFSLSQSGEVVRALALFVLGVSQIDKGPVLDDLDLPEDVTRFVDSFASDAIFLPNARHIIAGIRAAR